MGFRFWVVGFRFLGLGYRVEVAGFEVLGLRFEAGVEGLAFRPTRQTTRAGRTKNRTGGKSIIRQQKLRTARRKTLKPTTPLKPTT